MLTAGAGVASAGGELGESGATECRNVEVPTTVGGQSGAIAATLCTPPGATSLQILIHGFTYNRGYFDVAVEPETYSYARAANNAGYATLVIDRLGTGESLHPLSLFTTVEADIRTVHEVVRAARNGEFGTEYNKVMTVGHSLGSAVAQGEAGNYGDVDAVITTGFSSAINYLNAYIEIGGRSHPAVSDEKFADAGLDSMYVTSIPRTRTLFINPDNTDPRLNKYDEAELKDTNSSVENATLITYPFTNAIANIDVPVLVVTGTEDPFFCGLNKRRLHLLGVAAGSRARVLHLWQRRGGIRGPEHRSQHPPRAHRAGRERAHGHVRRHLRRPGQGRTGHRAGRASRAGPDCVGHSVAAAPAAGPAVPERRQAGGRRLCRAEAAGSRTRRHHQPEPGFGRGTGTDRDGGEPVRPTGGARSSRELTGIGDRAVSFGWLYRPRSLSR
jgi:pimeloyl-ACP methyl ester carboxylesterase